MRSDDFRGAGDRFEVIEVNTIPGMTPNSLLPKSAAGLGIGNGFVESCGWFNEIPAHIGSVIGRVLDVVNAGQGIKNPKQNNDKWSMGSLNQILISLESVDTL